MPVLMCWVAELADQSNKLITCINFSVQGERKGDTRVNSLSIKSCKLHFQRVDNIEMTSVSSRKKNQNY
jgi:hypothetical protein